MILNESWWIQSYIAKGIWRDEFPYAKYMYDVILIDCIRQLLSWQVGINHNWQVNVGKCGKWLKKYLTNELYEEYLSTYPGVDYEHIWTALFNAGNLIRKIGHNLANELGSRDAIDF